MLPFQEHVITELVQEDAVVVMAAGLGLHKLLAALLRLHSASSDGIIFLLSTSLPQRQALREELQDQDPKAELPVDINTEYSGSERLSCYTAGGCFFITSRILIVDMLNERVPLQRVAGIIVNNAHRITETCTEAFIVRLYRTVNKSGFIRAFSDRAQGMISGFLRTERIMKSLFVKKLLLWPRFHLSVTAALEENPPEVIDIRVPMTSYMISIQTAIVEVMDACFKELRKTNKIDVEDLTVENGLFKSFDEIIRRQLDPIWHTLSRKTKRLVEDLKTLRKLAEFLVRYDAVTFLRYLETLRASEGVHSVWLFAPPTHRIFEFAKRRVYQIVRVDKAKGPTLAGSGIAVSKSGQGRKGSQGRGKCSDLPAVVEVESDNEKPIIDNGGEMKSGETQNLIVDEDAKTKKDTIPSEKSEAPVGEKNGARRGSDRPGKSRGDAEGVELEVVLEEMPKWRILREILEEIEEERSKENICSTFEKLPQSSSHAINVVLVACKDERTCLQLQNIVEEPLQLMQAEWNKYLLEKADLHGMRTRTKKRNDDPKGFGILDGRAPKSKDVMGSPTKGHSLEQSAILAAAAEVADICREVIELGNESAQRVMKRCGRGGSSRKVGPSAQNKKRKNVKKAGLEGGKKAKINTLANGEGNSVVEDIQPSTGVGLSESIQPGVTVAQDGPSLEGSHGAVNKAAKQTHTKKALPPVHFYALESEQRILEVLRPSFIVVYDPDMNFVREMEVYKAEHPTQPLKVYFLFYENSTEAQKFEASIHRENDAFESLIRQKASMMISVDRDVQMLDSSPVSQSATGVALNVSTRKAGGRKASEKQMKIIVDMREFSSSLPCVLHQQGIQVLPVTLEVGDYILSPDICIERKSVADLLASFSSGRLYHQAETMTRYYKLPVLLIEFSQDKMFSLQSTTEVWDDISPGSIVSKISLLVLHFPRLRIVWSRSLHATADIFINLKANQDEPDVEKAMRVGVPSEDGLIEGDLRAENYNATAVELLRRLPGVTDANYRSLMDGCKSIAELALFSLEELAKLMGGQRPARMLREFLDAKCPTLS